MSDKLAFQADVSKMLDIVVNSLYSEKQIFLRELISNASDACDKLKYLALTNPDIAKASGQFKIKIVPNSKENKLTVSDNGIGMNKEDLINHLGTIAKSGTADFVRNVKDNGSVCDLIGQFGVGFYSAFMVADKVDVYTKSEDSTGAHWSCDGSENFTIEDFEKPERGTKIVAHLKDEYKEFANSARIKGLVEKYSAYVEFPIYVGDEKVNTHQAIWLKAKSELSDEQYSDFYKFQSHAFDNPLDWLHFKADAPVELNALIYIPNDNPKRLGL